MSVTRLIFFYFIFFPPLYFTLGFGKLYFVCFLLMSLFYFHCSDQQQNTRSLENVKISLMFCSMNSYLVDYLACPKREETEDQGKRQTTNL